ncbi:MAG TPA: hypothetical protein VNN22_13130 [Verrucomicrobiae bacterium]|nr:hypothetical protein [Verrucomicrobiae bacterium]
MNKFDLNAVLKAAKPTEGSDEYWNDIPREVLAQLRRPAPASPRNRPRWFPRLAWSFAATAACLAVILAISHRRGGTTSKDDLQSTKLIRETLAMFPNRVRAIVQDEHGLNLVLSENEDVPASTPIYVRICDGKQCASFVTFSGQEIQAGGQTVTVLADARGGIILTGNRFVWSNTERNRGGSRLKIEANNLGSVAM